LSTARAVPEPVRLRVRVVGVVQGVGFRPFVSAVAVSLGLTGFVGNDSTGVFAEVEGAPEAVQALVAALTRRPPPLARVESVSTEPRPPRGGVGFAIVESEQRAGRDALVTADAGTCEDCLAEIRDPTARRFGYPFTNCTNCGPRYTIVRQIPYDRVNTTMAGFTMCPQCQAEYDDPADRRFHAQPVCCPACGPQLRLVGGVTGDLPGDLPGDPMAAAAQLLAAGGVVAVKGLGGYHLAVDARNETAVAALRGRKHREDRPFAVMVADLPAARLLCEVDETQARLLTSPARPIVLLARRSGTRLARSVAPGTAELGLLLPYTPLHHLLLAAHGGPLVMTSGNTSDEPIAYDDSDAGRRLSGIADAFLTHDRPIQTRVDDSVVRVLRDRPQVLRRSRGYAPDPLLLPWEFPRQVLACGPELKNTFCLARGRYAFVSHHIGDLENYETLTSYVEGIAHLRGLFGIDPEVLAYDLHPEYLSTKHAFEQTGVELVAVQHHHAHIASCLADNGVAGPVIGVAFDGLGMGPDGTLWGGEVLVADLVGFERVAHLEPVPMPGGARAVRQPWRMAASYLDLAWPDGPPAGLAVVRRHGRQWADVLAVTRAGINAPLTSSVGRLFDAVAALLDVRDEVTYEGQAAIELERLADPAEQGAYDVGVEEADGVGRVGGAGLVRSVVADRLSGTSAAVVAARLHNSLARTVVALCGRVRTQRGLDTVALSGGVFQNVLLHDRCVSGLQATGFTVLTHFRVPTNDGGISLGQAAVAGARDRAGLERVSAPAPPG